jgi:hypothetical protein
MPKKEDAPRRGAQMNPITPRSEQPTNSWRGRARSHFQNILDLLTQRGPAGVLSSELYSDHARFGVSGRNRISEMRAAGLDIETIHLSSGPVRYVLHPRDWYEKQTGKPRASVVQEKSTTDDLPLFVGVR